MAGSRESARRGAAFVFLLLLGAYLLTASGHLGGGCDEEVPFRIMERLWSRGTVTLDEELGGVKKGRGGRLYACFGLAQPVLAMPWFLAGRAAGLALGMDERGVRAVERVFVAHFNAFVTALGGALVYLLCLSLGASSRGALWGALGYGLGSLAWSYSKTFMSEPLLATCLAGTALGVASGTARGALLGGLSLGVAVATRFFAVLALPPAIWALGRERGRAAAFGLAAGAGVAWSLAYNWWRYGNPLDFGYPEGVTWAFTASVHRGLYGLLASPGKGLIWYSPASALALWGLVRAARGGRDGAIRFSLWTFALWLLFFSARRQWWGAWSWGPRYLVPVLPLLSPGLAFLVDEWASEGARRRILLGFSLLCLSAIVQLPALLVYNGLYLSVATKVVPFSALLHKPALSPLLGHWALLSARTLDILPARLLILSPAVGVLWCLPGILLLAIGVRGIVKGR